MDEQRTIRSRLNKMFSRYQYVGIRNITQKPISWTVALEENEILNMGPADAMNEEQMAKKGGGPFLPSASPLRQKQRVVNYTFEPGEKKMVPGEAAYVLIDKIYRFAVREQYGSNKAGLTRIGLPSTQDELIPKIVIGPIIKNVGQVLNDFVGQMQDNLEGFSNVEAYNPSQATEQPNTQLQTQNQTEGPSEPNMKDLRAEAAKLNITVPFGATKEQLLELLREPVTQPAS